MKAAIYCRVSTEDQNPDTQEKICRKYCEGKNLEIFKVYKDVISGGNFSRPEFNKLIEDMRQFKFKAVLVTKLDRIGRSLQHLLTLFEEFKNKGINFIAATQNIDTSTSSGKLQMQIMGAFAEFERNLISERTKEGLKFAKNVGKRGKDKSKRSNKGYKERWKRSRKKKELIPKLKMYSRICVRCDNEYETPHRQSKVCKDCRGGKKPNEI